MRRSTSVDQIKITCCGVSSNVLSPTVKETLGMEARLLQSTADSPIGLGIRSQSCSWDLNKALRSQLTDIHFILCIKSTSPYSYSQRFYLQFHFALIGFASIPQPSHKPCTSRHAHHSKPHCVCPPHSQ